MVDHLRRGGCEPVDTCVSRDALFLSQSRGAVTRVRTAGPEHQRARGRIDYRQVNECRDVVLGPVQDIGSQDREIAQRPVVVIDMSHLIVGHERHQIDAIQPLHARQSLESGVAGQVIVGNDDDLRDESAAGEALADLLQQLLLVRLIQRPGRPARRQECQTDPHRDVQLGNRIARGRLPMGVEKLDQARGLRGLPARRAVRPAHHRAAARQHAGRNQNTYPRLAHIASRCWVFSWRGTLSRRVSPHTTHSARDADFWPLGIAQ